MDVKRYEEIFEQSLFRSRWLMAPFYVGLVVALMVFLTIFVHAMWSRNSEASPWTCDENDGRSVGADPDRSCRSPPI